MQTFIVRNVQEAYYFGLKWLREYGNPEFSRNGPVVVSPTPVMTVYDKPIERVLLDVGRDANPFFHLMESFWMLAGRNDVESIVRYNSKMASYSDNGRTFNAAYGHRWRFHFGNNQIIKVIQQLRADPTTRRAVIQMWDGSHDGMSESKDLPCNTAVFFRALPKIGGGHRLDMTITNRSNDIIWGAYGANAVHMSVMQEFVAAMCGMDIGRMYQLSNNFHAYGDVMEKVGMPNAGVAGAYGFGLYSSPLFLKQGDTFANELVFTLSHYFDIIDKWWTKGSLYDQDLSAFMPEDAIQTLGYMRSAYWEFRNKNLQEALNLSREIPGSDWNRACTEWIERRIANKEKTS